MLEKLLCMFVIALQEIITKEVVLFFICHLVIG